MKRFLRLFLLVIGIVFLNCACGEKQEAENHIYACLGMNVMTLDPVGSAELITQSVYAALYDTLLQYKYNGKDNIPEPSMLTKMPQLSADGLTLNCELRDDLFFQDGAPFQGQPKENRRVTSRDVVFSLLRLADARLNSPSYWILRDYVADIKSFYEESKKYAEDDYSVYDKPVRGFTIVDNRHFSIHLTKPNPNFIYLLAMPPTSIVSRKAVEFYGVRNFRQNPCGSGPFKISDWRRDYSIDFVRNDEYREEYFTNAQNPADRTRRLPLADRITCYLVKQNVSSWLLFLQGNLDFYQLDAEHFQSLVDKDGNLIPSLKKRQISLLYAPRFETNYIGFNFRDPILGANADLRRAISLAIDKQRIISHAGGILSLALGPVPPGLAGAIEDAKDSPFASFNPALAHEYLKRAGYENGINPKTGKPLKITIDFPGTDTFNQQLGEIIAKDLKNIGIECIPCLNTRPRFQSKILNGEVQLFRYSWIADYPDAENFLQVFYSKNAAGGVGCNRACYSNSDYDALYERIQFMPHSPERDALCRKMVAMLLPDAPWIFETHQLHFFLTHCWLQNFKLHDFAMNRWKYLSAPSSKRRAEKADFKPITLSELH